MAFVVGTTLNLECDFEVAGVATTPTTYTLTIRKPSESAGVAQSSITVPATGTLRKVYVPTEEGLYKGLWTGTGAAAGKKRFSFMVETDDVT